MCIYTYVYIYIYVYVGRSVGRSSRVGSVDVLPHFAHFTATPLHWHPNPPLHPTPPNPTRYMKDTDRLNDLTTMMFFFARITNCNLHFNSVFAGSLRFLIFWASPFTCLAFLFFAALDRRYSANPTSPLGCSG